ncbi:hypothetical protein JVT61DRAFT_9557 [Boletus reticuloceps]|uniref:Uncharacterized protein n=1 Tax=Boletus reticuloceps TaxID=495285 RepID=A0A8I2YG95_9AGAM|nr:hypothetical protein JVT61DRAFT_9557 [Boletus reticuloceps]
MPPHLRDSLQDLLALTCPTFSLTAQDSASDQPTTDFEAMHWSWYYKYGTSGDGVPRDVHPYCLDRAGCMRTNHSQFILYMSQETFEHEDLYHHFVEVFSGIFEWVRQNLKSQLPEEYEMIAQFSTILPENASCPTHPFTSLVLNINACTRVHRDSGDLHFCLVMPIGQFQGGSLVLVEPGLVLDLRQGDFAVFQSCDVSHFNLNYIGRHASLVLHTDRGMETWRKNQNNWSHNIYLQYFQEGEQED